MVITDPGFSEAVKSHLTKLAKRAAELTAACDGGALAKVEREIDEIVYRLFDLTPEEIALIDDRPMSPKDIILS